MRLLANEHYVLFLCLPSWRQGTNSTAPHKRGIPKPFLPQASTSIQSHKYWISWPTTFTPSLLHISPTLTHIIQNLANQFTPFPFTVKMIRDYVLFDFKMTDDVEPQGTTTTPSLWKEPVGVFQVSDDEAPRAVLIEASLQIQLGGDQGRDRTLRWDHLSHLAGEHLGTL